MKTRFIASFSVLIGSGALLFFGCQQNPTSPVGTQLPLSPGGTSAHPALTWSALTANPKDHNYIYSYIMVSDTDDSHQTAVFAGYGPSGSVVTYFTPCWSPTGGSIAIGSAHFGSGLDSLLTMDISVNSKGTPVVNNIKHIYAFPSGSIYSRNGLAWSSTTSMGEIAYTWESGSTNRSPNHLSVISQSGGTPTVIYSTDTGINVPAIALINPTWSPDDTRLAVARTDSMIMIFNTSNWSYVDSIKCPGKIAGLEWSRSGLNMLAFSLSSSTAPYEELYYCDPSTGSTPIASGLGYSLYPTWSPNNSSLLYVGNNGSAYYIDKVGAFTTNTQVLWSSNALVKWKR